MTTCQLNSKQLSEKYKYMKHDFQKRKLKWAIKMKKMFKIHSNKEMQMKPTTVYFSYSSINVMGICQSCPSRI